MDVPGHVTSFDQSEFFISASHSYATLKDIYEIGPWPADFLLTFLLNTPGFNKLPFDLLTFFVKQKIVSEHFNKKIEFTDPINIVLIYVIKVLPKFRASPDQ